MVRHIGGTPCHVGPVEVKGWGGGGGGGGGDKGDVMYKLTSKRAVCV